MKLDAILAISTYPRGTATIVRVLSFADKGHVHEAACMSPKYGQDEPVCKLVTNEEFLANEFGEDPDTLSGARGLPTEPGVYRCTLEWVLVKRRDGLADTFIHFTSVEYDFADFVFRIAPVKEAPR